VNNIYVSSQNHNFNPYDYLNHIPHERVGSSTSRAIRNSRNTSSTPTIIPCSIRSGKCTRTPSKRTGKTATLLEWDDRIPSFDEVHREALKADCFYEDYPGLRAILGERRF
jgi:hypothetical protein